MADQDADFIIIGAGSAGCVLANRLSADPKNRVILLEAGGDDRPLSNLRQFGSNFNIYLPAGFTRMLSDPKINWNYQTEPDPNNGSRTFAFPRGKVLGGSSSINGMLYVRGLPEDYDGWRQLGCEGWAWADVEPVFEAAERQHRAGAPPSTGPGTLDVSDVPMQHFMLDKLVEAFVEAGAPFSDDLNGTAREGIARVRLNARKGLRRSSAAVHLHPARNRSNLRIITGAQASRILFDGSRATGVEYVQGGETRQVTAAREVILSGGAINSPQLLELSGIGQAGRLRELGIEIIADSPGVGENLQDHYATMIRSRLKPGTSSFNSLSRGLGLVGQALRFAFTRSGLLASGGASLTAFLKSDPALDLPDLQFFASPATIDFSKMVESGQMAMEQEPGMTIGAYGMRPRSRGTIHLKSADFRDHPAIRPNFLAEESDRMVTIAGLRWARRIFATPALAPYVDHELTPGADVKSDEDLVAFARAAGSTAYHQSGTCAMGVGAAAVVDPQLRVKGASGLRVVDASVMPNVVSGNTNAATMMIAEKAARMILTH